MAVVERYTAKSSERTVGRALSGTHETACTNNIVRWYCRPVASTAVDENGPGMLFLDAIKNAAGPAVG